MQTKKSTWDSFTNMYSLSKTSRFELKPVGKTKGNELVQNLILEDEKREKDFNTIKKIMDDYYRDFIERVLSVVSFDVADLENHANIYFSLKKDAKNEKLKEEYAKSQKILRKQLFDLIKSQEDFSSSFGEKFVKKTLPKWLEKNNRLQEKELVSQFKRWTTYFVGFFKNRENVFSEKEIHTSLIYRIVHDNLPKYLDNIERFEKLADYKEFDYSIIENDLKDVLDGLNLKEFFSLENFNACLNQEGINKFNLLLGGKSEEGNKKIQGLNELINLFSQKLESKESKSFRKLKLVPLFKQILSDRISSSFVLERFKDKHELFQTIDYFYNGRISEDKDNFDGFRTISVVIKELILNLKNKDIDHIYIKKDSLSKISQELFGDYNKLNEALRKKFSNNLKGKLNNKGKLFTDNQIKNEVEKLLKNKFFSLKEVEDSVHFLDDEEKKSVIKDYFLLFKQNELDGSDLFKQIAQNYNEYSKIDKNNQYKLNEKKCEKDVEVIKQLLDSILDFYHFIKPLHTQIKKDEKDKGVDALEKDSEFYGSFDSAFEDLKQIIPLYNKVRNFVTQKPFSTKKFKLNFNNPDKQRWVSDFRTNASLIFRSTKNSKENYYLGIVPKKLSATEYDSLFKIEESDFELLDYAFQKPDNKQVPRLFIRSKGSNFSPSVKKYSLPIEDIIEIYDEGFFRTEYKKVDEKKFKESLIKLIDYFKKGLLAHEDFSRFDFCWKESDQYENIADFYHDVEVSCYSLDFRLADEKIITKLVDEGKLYLFQIWNKDFSEYSKGKPNLHTIYWRELFSEENLKDVVYKLNGEAELFYRKKSIQKNITHPKNEEIINKNPIQGKMKSKFQYDLIKDKRYTEDKFLFHCPITLNFKANGSKKNIHKLINKHINQTRDEITVLGIDRGERNLAYYSLIDSKGKILEQNSFNIISDDLQRKLDYQEKLDQIEGDRDKARKNWKKISNIKEMKEGYLSQVIHKIATLAIEKNAIIVLENLNFGFKRGRFKIEKQVYQKFEKMLIDKLNYLVFKNKKSEEAGGSLNAYQLTNKFDTFQKLGSQSGILYYVDAYKTSKICPRTGFINLLFPKFKNIDKSKNFLSKFNFIKYCSEEDLFEFNFNYSSFSDDKKTIFHNLIKDNWSVWSNGIKLINKRDKNSNNQWKTFEFNVNDELKSLFKEYGVVYSSEENLISAILSLDNKNFFEKLLTCLKHILQLRNSYLDSELKIKKQQEGDKYNVFANDFILSCVKDKNGDFFDSRKAKNNEIHDADANGAYHIALKGLMLIEKIKEEPNYNNKTKIDLKIDRTEFVNYVIKKND